MEIQRVKKLGHMCRTGGRYRLHCMMLICNLIYLLSMYAFHLKTQHVVHYVRRKGGTNRLHCMMVICRLHLLDLNVCS